MVRNVWNRCREYGEVNTFLVELITYFHQKHATSEKKQ